MRTLTPTLQANGFRCTSSSTATLRVTQHTVTRSRWQRDIDGRPAVVEVQQLDDGPERGVLQPDSRRACAGILTDADLTKALQFHLFDITINTPQP